MLSDDEWGRLKAAQDAALSGTGRPLRDERRVVEGVIWRQRDGAKWRALPAAFGPWWRAARLPISLVARGRVGAGLGVAARCGSARLGRGGQGRHLDPGPPQGGGRKRRAVTQALGRSRRGIGAKALRAADARGRAVLFVLLPGQASEAKAAPGMLERLSRLGLEGRVVCDCGYSSDPWCTAIRAMGADPCVPGQPTHPRAPPHDRLAWARRHRIETLWARLRERRTLPPGSRQSHPGLPGLPPPRRRNKLVV